jgi:hypothetical protein
MGPYSTLRSIVAGKKMIETDVKFKDKNKSSAMHKVCNKDKIIIVFWFRIERLLL